jgi:hypothetical protein
MNNKNNKNKNNKKKKQSKIIRTLTPKSPELFYQNNEHYRDIFQLNRCHWGQLKLFYTELEFISLCAEKINLADAVVVYIGACPGDHLELVHEFFPDLHWILYDPRPCKMKSGPYFEVHNGNDGLFNDASIQQVFNSPFMNGTNGKRKILLITDLRTRNLGSNKEFEDAVFGDMINQQRWGILLQAEAMMFKLRFPYIFTDMKNIGNKEIWKYDTSEIQDFVKIKKSKEDNKIPTQYKYLYLDGTIYYQILAPFWSTETRLIVFRDNNPKNKPYQLKYYDSFKYESQCFYFNVFDRTREYKYKDSQLLRNYLIGYNDSYDSVAQFYLMEQYYKNYRKRKYNFAEIVRLLYQVAEFMRKHGGSQGTRTPITCAVYSLLTEHIRSVNITKEEWREYIRKHGYNTNNKMQKLVHNIEQKYDESVAEIDNQMLTFYNQLKNASNQNNNSNNNKPNNKNTKTKKKIVKPKKINKNKSQSTILTRTEYEKQILDLDSDKQKLKYYYDELINFIKNAIRN